jgi:hypothetical protein
MELDDFDLEQIWQRGEHNPPQKKHSQADITQMLKKSTTSTLGKINKSIFIEAGLMFVMSALLGVILENITLAIVISVVSVVYYFLKYKVLNYVPNTSIKKTIHRLVTIFQRYLIAYYLLLWGCMGFVGSTFFINFRKHLQKYTDQNFYMQIALDCIITSLIVALFYFAGNYYLNLLYGNYFKELQKYKKELDDMEE